MGEEMRRSAGVGARSTRLLRWVGWALVAAAAVVLGLPILEWGHWRYAQHQNNAEGYLSYLERWPGGRYEERAAHLYDGNMWAKAIEVNTIDGYRAYLQTRFGHQRVKSAQKKIDRIQWTESQPLFTVESLEAYIKKYPESSYRGQAEERLRRIRLRRAKREPTVARLEEYLRLYPDQSDEYLKAFLEYVRFKESIQAIVDPLRSNPRPSQLRAGARRIVEILRAKYPAKQFRAHLSKIAKDKSCTPLTAKDLAQRLAIAFKENRPVVVGFAPQEIDELEWTSSFEEVAGYPFTANKISGSWKATTFRSRDTMCWVRSVSWGPAKVRAFGGFRGKAPLKRWLRADSLDFGSCTLQHRTMVRASFYTDQPHVSLCTFVRVLRE